VAGRSTRRPGQRPAVVGLPAAPRARPAGAIVQESTGYRLLITPDDLDAATFGHRIRRARGLIGSDDDAAERQLTDALALWRDEPLTDAGDGDYVRGYAARWAEDRLLAIKERAGIKLRRERGRSCWVSWRSWSVIIRWTSR
jgi:Bacterial transcriptional activator domain